MQHSKTQRISLISNNTSSPKQSQSWNSKHLLWKLVPREQAFSRDRYFCSIQYILWISEIHFLEDALFFCFDCVMLTSIMLKLREHPQNECHPTHAMNFRKLRYIIIEAKILKLWMCLSFQVRTIHIISLSHNFFPRRKHQRSTFGEKADFAFFLPRAFFFRRMQRIINLIVFLRNTQHDA